ncbi:MAG: ferredoxin [Candidatus Abawacabacteria bacterium]|nr:ferredoxin [Candidatus Abawacabacteria bacterium]
MAEAQNNNGEQLVVDLTCIGCNICTNVAEQTFVMYETDDGLKSKVINQSGNTPTEIQQAIDMCPVTAIHWQKIAEQVKKDLRN